MLASPFASTPLVALTACDSHYEHPSDLLHGRGLCVGLGYDNFRVLELLELSPSQPICVTNTGGAAAELGTRSGVTY